MFGVTIISKDRRQTEAQNQNNGSGEPFEPLSFPSPPPRGSSIWFAQQVLASDTDRQASDESTLF
jgi:hypothetical protein